MFYTLLVHTRRSYQVNTSWFKQNTAHCVSHEYRMQHLLECHIFSTNTDRHEQWKGVTQRLFL